MARLTQTEINHFFTAGYLIIDLELNDPFLNNIIIDTVKAYPEKTGLCYSHGTRIQDAWKFSEHIRNLALLPDILDTLESLYLRTPLPFQTLNFPVGTQQPIHSDTIHFNSFPRNFMCGVLVALEDIDADNGPVEYCIGSHFFPEYNMEDIGKGISHENYKYYESFIDDVVNTNHLNPVPAIMKKGQAFIWHGNLLHGGSSHLDKSRTRHSQTTHYFFEGCRYYTPMMSTPEKISWRDPEYVNSAKTPVKQYSVHPIIRSWLSGKAKR